MAGAGRDSPGRKFWGQCHVRKTRREKSGDELGWNVIGVTVTLIAGSEDQSAEVCQGILALQEGWGEQWGLVGCWDAQRALSPHSCALNLGSEATLPRF